MGLISTIRSLFPSGVSQAQPNRLDEYVLRQIANIALYPDPSWSTYLGGYTDNGDVFTVINKITEPASGVPIYQYDKDGEINENGKMIALFNKPNPYQSRSELIEAALTFYLIFGDSYTACQRPANGLNKGKPIRVDTLPPQWMEIILGTVFDPVAGYKYMMGSQPIDYPVEDVMHWKEFNPDYDRHGVGHLKGMSRLRPIIKSVVGDGAAYDSMVAALQHNGAFGLLSILGEDGAGKGVSDSYISRVKEKFRDEYTGAKKAGSIVINNKPHQWSNFGQNAREMRTPEISNIFKGAIADAYNVPVMLLAGSNDRTFNNYKEAKAALWTDAIMPSVDAYLDKMTSWLAPQFGEVGETLRADYSEIDVLQKDTASMIAWMVLSKSFSKNEIREASGAERMDDPKMDVVYESAGTVPLEELGLMPDQALTEEVAKALNIRDYRHAPVN